MMNSKLQLLLIMVVLTAAPCAGEDIVYTHTWDHKTVLPISRSDLTATTVDDSILLLGGCSGNNTLVKFTADESAYICNVVSNTSLIYLPKSDTYKTIPDMPRHRFRHAAVAVGSKVYVLGGTDDTDEVIAEVDVFDMATMSWTTLADPMLQPASDLTAFALGGKIFAHGGYVRPWSLEEPTLNATRVLDTAVAGAAWESAASSPNHRGDHSSVTFDGEAIIVGGFSHVDWSSSLASMEAFNGTHWRALPSMPVSRGDLAVARLHGRFLAVGGETLVDYVSTPLRDVEAYDPAAAAWSKVDILPERRFRFAAASHGDAVYVFGGQAYLAGGFKEEGSHYATVDTVTAFREEIVPLSPTAAPAIAPAAPSSTAAAGVAPLASLVVLALAMGLL